MIERTLLALCCAGLLSVPAVAGDEAKKPGCCAKPAKAAAAATGEKATAEKGGKMKCSLTGKVVDKCCCVEPEGKLHCTLADKDVETCCCTPVAAKAAK